MRARLSSERSAIARLAPRAPRPSAEIAHVEAGAEGAAFAGEHHGAHALLGLQPLAGVDQRLEHGVVEGVHLVRPHHAHVGDAVLDIDADAVFMGQNLNSGGTSSAKGGGEFNTIRAAIDEANTLPTIRKAR